MEEKIENFTQLSVNCSDNDFHSSQNTTIKLNISDISDGDINSLNNSYSSKLEDNLNLSTISITSKNDNLPFEYLEVDSSCVYEGYNYSKKDAPR